MKKIVSFIPHAIALFGAVVFLDSLRFKFTNAPETQVIFGKLDAWAATWGASGLFAPAGLFSQYVIGAAELVASLFLLIGIASMFRRFQVVGALIAFVIMTGAVFFHLFTPLGIDPNMDGGGLFVVAVLLWLGSAALIYIRRSDFHELVKLKLNYFFPKK